MHRRATAFRASFSRVVGGLAFALMLATSPCGGGLAQTTTDGRAGRAQHPVQQLPYAAGQSLVVSAGPGGFFDPALAPLGEPIQGGTVSLTSYLDDSPTAELVNVQPPDTVPDPGSWDCCDDWWRWQVLPEGLIYRSYLAGVKEPRIAAQWVHDRRLGWIWDVALGGRTGMLRYGNSGRLQVEGWQADLEGAALARIDIENEMDMVATDFRVGVPLTYSRGRYQTKLAYYHLSSHLGDEFMLRNPGTGGSTTAAR